MKSLSILRVLFCTLFLALAGTTAYDCYANGVEQATETIASTAFLGLFASVTNTHAKKVLDYKTYRGIAASGRVTVYDQSGSQVGQQNLMQRNPGFSGAGAAQARTLNSGMDTTVRNVLPESTMAGLLSFVVTADGAHVKANLVPIFPTKTDDALPAGVTFVAGNFSDYNDYRDFYLDNPVILGDIQVESTDQTNFANPLKCTQRAPNGATQTNNTSWNSIGKNPMNQDQTVRIIGQSGWTVGASRVRYELMLNPTSTMSFDCKIALISDVRQFRQTNG